MPVQRLGLAELLEQDHRQKVWFGNGFAVVIDSSPVSRKRQADPIWRGLR
ncbi:hypothetical protein X772_31490 [Mesorhizobium sp. LSJC280B00]|nr:hypothetical protein X772_31490 [Mesorhizobium sp. LSJC280B00]